MAESTQQIWMEGRVVGLSAHEIYLRQQMAVDPNTTPATEREWLAATLASGASVLLHIPTSGAGVGEFDHNAYDFKLPEHSKLCAANTVVASYFAGEGVELDGYNYAKYVKSYGQLIPNTPENHPTGTVADYDSGAIAGSLTDWSADEVSQLRDYMKIVDGVVLQPGTWTDSTVSHDPVKDFTPDLSKPATVRLHIKGQIKQDFWIVLTGFSMRAVVVGESKFETGSLNTDNPQDGDYLGPETYPWANKIVFTVPTAAIKYQSQYARQINNKAEKQVADTSIIDFRETDPATYYTGTESAIARTSVTVPLNVTQAVSMLDNTAVLTVYQRSPKFAPALFGTFVKQEGQQKLNPIDTVAPRTLKLFHAEPDATAKDFENSIPLNYALIRHNDDYVLRQLDNNKNVIPVAEATVAQSGGIYKVTHTHGKVKVKSVAITRADGTDLPMTGTGGTVQDDMLTWADLLKYLANDNQIDTIGSILREFRETIVEFLPRGEEGKQYAIEIVNGEIRLVEFDAVTITKGDIKASTHPEFKLVTASNPQGTTNFTMTSRQLDLAVKDDHSYSVNLVDKNGARPGTVTGGVAGTLEAQSDDSQLDWNLMLGALNHNYGIDVVGKDLKNLRTVLRSMENGATYSLQRTIDGHVTIVPTAEFPNFMMKTIHLLPIDWNGYAKGDSGYSNSRVFIGTMVLDIFGYTSTHNYNGSEFVTANMIATLTCQRGGAPIAGRRFRQAYKVDPNDGHSMSDWLQVVEWLYGILGTTASGSDGVNMTIATFPLYQSSDPYFLPRSPLGVSSLVRHDGAIGQLIVSDIHNDYGWSSNGYWSDRAFPCALVASPGEYFGTATTARL